MKVLVLRFSSIGDIVLTSPVVRCLATQLGAEVHFLTKAAFAQIPAANPSVQRVFALGKGQNHNDKVFFCEKMPDLLRILQKENYDYVIDLHHNLRSFRVKWALGRPSFAFQKLNFQKWMLVRWGIDILPQKHIVERYMDTVTTLGVQYDGQGLDFHYAPNTLPTLDAAVDALLPTLRSTRHRTLSAAKTSGAELSAAETSGAELSAAETNSTGIIPYIAVVIGAAHGTKRLPEEKIIEICQKQPYATLLLGGPDERAAGERIAAAVSDGRAINACGALSLFGSARAVERATAVITHDTGLMHIAAAFRKRIVSVWGSTVPEFGMTPFYPDGIDLNTSVEVKGLPCRPCSKIGFDTCPKGHFKCMQGIDLGAIRGEF